MDVTLLGSGEAVGQPAPLCDCEHCADGPRRRRPALLVETDETTLVLDAGPDLPEQLRETATTGVDAFLVTHGHFDHVAGLQELHHAAMGFDRHVGVAQGLLDPDPFDPAEKPDDPEFAVYLPDGALARVEETTPHLTEHLDLRGVEAGDGVAVGDLRVLAFPVDHGGPAFDTFGFAVEERDDPATVVYAPDVRTFGDGGRESAGDDGEADDDARMAAGDDGEADDDARMAADDARMAADDARTADVDDQPYANADLLFAEGAALFRAYGHGDESALRAALAAADADRTVLVNLSEHLQRMTTDEMREVAGEAGYELGSDFAAYEV